MKGGTQMTKTGTLILVLTAIISLIFLRPSVGRGEQLTVQQKSDLPTIEKAMICEKVEDRTPVGTRDSFPSSLGTLYCFTELMHIPTQGSVYHVWYYGKKEMARIELPISPPRWRTWSSKTILSNWKGDWKVEIVFKDHILRTLTFAVE
jgi:hypothetical protein